MRWLAGLGVGLVMALSTGCAADDADAPDDEVADEELIKKTGPTSSWSYKGIMPELDSPRLTVSLKGHTVHVEGLLPRGFDGRLPFHARTEPAGSRTKVHVAYPIATVDPNGRLADGTPTRNP